MVELHDRARCGNICAPTVTTYPDYDEVSFAIDRTVTPVEVRVRVAEVTVSTY